MEKKEKKVLKSTVTISITEYNNLTDKIIELEEKLKEVRTNNYNLQISLSHWRTNYDNVANSNGEIRKLTKATKWYHLLFGIKPKI